MHRPGEVAPMSLLTDQGTRPRAKAIRQAVLTRKMPPWLADPTHGKLANDRMLAGVDTEAGACGPVDARFDNSRNNPANPDPGKEVRWGDQSWDAKMNPMDLYRPKSE